MSRFIQKQGFTLIELMVVIVIIGVLASLAIPRFSEASDKAKVAEAPRILASFESAYLAGTAEIGSAVKADEIIFDPSALTSKWFAYSYTTSGTTVTGLEAKANNKIGKIAQDETIFTKDSASPVGQGKFVHCYSGTWADGRKYVPNFLDATKPTPGC